MITVYTTILFGYDNLRPPLCIEPGVRYVCFTDEPMRCEPWEIQPAYQPYRDHGKNSRIPKILAHLFVDTEYSIYHDGCLQLAASPSKLIEENLTGADLALYRHPCRKSIYEEMNCCERFNIGNGPEMREQVERYRSHGVGEGLWAGGVILRHHTEMLRAFNEGWWREYLSGCSRDQFSLVFTIRSIGLAVNTIDADIIQDPARFNFVFHGDFENAGDNARFTEQRKAAKERRAILKDLCR